MSRIRLQALLLCLAFIPASTAGAQTDDSTVKDGWSVNPVPALAYGQTVVIGGILSDTHGQLADRWPIYADIPLIGRLFTESAAQAQKDNLIISVSTRLISGDGIPVRTNTQNGLPDFRR